MSFSYAKVCFHSLRGMKELDLFFKKFNTSVYHTLDAESQQIYHQLLAEQDGDLWDWLFHITPPPKSYVAIIEMISPSHIGVLTV